MEKKSDMQNTPTHKLMGRIFRESMRPHLFRMIIAILCMIVVAIMTALSAHLMKPLTDDVFVSKQTAALKEVGLSIIAVFLIKGIANYFQSLLMNDIGLKVIADNQCNLYNRIISQSVDFFHKNRVGTLVSRFTVDINIMKTTVANVWTSLGKDLSSLVGLIAVMFISSWQLAATAFLILPIAIFPLSRLGKRMRKVTANTQSEIGEFNTVLEQSFHGIRAVKSYGIEETEKSKIKDLTNKIYLLTYKAAKIRSISTPLMETLGGLVIAAVLMFGGSRIIDGSTSPGEFIAFLTALLLAYEPMKRLANLNVSLQEGLAASERYFQMMDYPISVVDKPEATHLDVNKGEIVINNVTFSYENSEPVLNDISLRISGGQQVALVGSSGGGKSTIMNLISRFYDVGKGNISIDNQNIANVTQKSLLDNIAFVSQDVVLFDDTIYNNILWGKVNATYEQVVNAAKSASAHDFISSFTEGYNTIVGERGTKLSGGQKQRIAIARAILKDAPILLLDEATSALDNESERRVQEALEKLMSNRTTLVIAHRLSTIEGADLIYVIDHGKVLESGKHNELLSYDSYYSKLHNNQLLLSDSNMKV